MLALFFPGLFSISLGLLLVLSPWARHACTPALPYFPWAVLALGGFLGWRFNRSRLSQTLLLLAVAGLLQHTSSRLPALQADLWLPLAIPPALLLTLVLPEKGLFTLRGLTRTALVFGPLLAGIAAASLAPDTLRQLASWSPRLPLSLSPPLPASLATSTAALLISVWWCWRHPEPLDLGLLACQFLWFASRLPGHSLDQLTWLGLAGLAPSLAIVEMSLQMAFRDELTGLHGRRALNESLQRLGSRYCIAMLDIDHFKKFNDRHGHDVGDQVLKMVAGRLSGVGGGGKPFRYGGEEFAILFPGRDLQECRPWLEKLREEVEQAVFTTRRRYRRPKQKPARPRPADSRNRALRVTISIGAAQRQRSMRPEEVIKAADKALYRAKKAGRNRVCA